ncbi:MAG: GcrA family cell cycle regulator [Pseudomonas paracarnis]
MSDKMTWDGRTNRRLKQLLKAECSYREIAGILGCSPSAVGGRVHRLGLATHPEKERRPRAANYHAKPSSPESIFLNGEPLVFAVTDQPCARCAVRESVHHEHGCGQFAADIRVRLK